MEHLIAQLKNLMKIMVDETINRFKVEVQNSLTNSFGLFETKANLKPESESEMIESYNRRDHIKVIGLEMTCVKNFERTETIIEKLPTIAKKLVHIQKSQIIQLHVASNRSLQKANRPNANRQSPSFLEAESVAEWATLKYIRNFEDTNKTRTKFTNWR